MGFAMDCDCVLCLNGNRDCDSPYALTNYTLDHLEKHWAKEVDFVICECSTPHATRRAGVPTLKLDANARFPLWFRDR